ncbi:hypothetical protein [Nocardioides psychrotolerans]|uniref:hypothetical protein n=1 Tax=Nocardioides psychrotolerans TaxID=1005945 RepID=UPI0031382F5D
MGIEKHEEPGLVEDPGPAPTLGADLATLTRLLLDLPLPVRESPAEPGAVDPAPDSRRSTALLAELAFLDE